MADVHPIAPKKGCGARQLLLLLLFYDSQKGSLGLMHAHSWRADEGLLTAYTGLEEPNVSKALKFRTSIMIQHQGRVRLLAAPWPNRQIRKAKARAAYQRSVAILKGLTR